MKRIVLLSVFLGALGAVLASSSSWADDYSDIDCNAAETRRDLMEMFNDGNDDMQALDSYDQITIQAGKGVLICEGSYELSDTTKWRLRFEQKNNSLGDPIYTFTPLRKL